MRRKLNLQEYALWLLGAREYSVKRLREKCVERYPDESEAIEVLINKFVQKKYLDDERFCETMICSEILKGNGAQKIKQKLVQKGIKPSLAQAKCAELIVLDEAIAPARRVAEKKKIQIQRKYPELSDYEKRAKLTQYLAGRGYEYTVIKEALE